MFTDSHIVRTKLHQPPVTFDQVVRPELIERLEEFRHLPLTLVAAPAGYGKSIAISHWLAQSDVVSCWISLSEDEDYLNVFVRYLIEAVLSIFPDQLMHSRGLLPGNVKHPWKTIAHTLINDLDEIDLEFVVVLDDFHLIENEDIHNLVNELLRYIPQNMHLVVIARRDPPLDITNLRAHSRVHEIRMRDLSFTPDQTVELIKRVSNIELQDASVSSSIVERTEGWITALRLMLLQVHSEHDLVELFQQLEGNPFIISEFLTEEILVKESEDMQNLLLFSSLFDRFGAELIDVLLTVPRILNTEMTGARFIEKLQKAQMFIISLDSEMSWFRYHHLFRELLAAQLKSKRSKTDINNMRIRVGRWFEDREYYEEAFSQYIEGEDIDAAVRLFAKCRHELNAREDWHTLWLWLEMLPEERCQVEPDLLLQQALLAATYFEFEKIPALINSCQVLIADSEQKKTFQGEINFHLGVLNYWGGQAEVCLELLESAASLENNTAPYLQTNIALYLGLARFMNGHYYEAVSGFYEAIARTLKSDIFYIGYMMGGQGYLNILSCRPERTVNLGKRLENLAKRTIYHNIREWGIYFQAYGSLQALSLDSAIGLFNKTASHLYGLEDRAAVDALAGLAVAQQLLGQTYQVNRTIEILTKRSEQNRDWFSQILAESTKARINLLQNDAQSALTWARSFQPNKESSLLFIWIEVPSLTWANIMVRAGTDDEVLNAVAFLEELRDITRSIHYINQLVEIQVILAIAYSRLGDQEKALAVVRQALESIGNRRWLRPFVEAGDQMQAIVEFGMQRSDKFDDSLSQLKEGFDNLTENNEAERVQSYNADQRKSEAGTNAHRVLSRREREIVELLIQGLRNREIAAKLFISEATVKKHLYNVFQKFDVHNRIQLTNEVTKAGLLQG